MDNRWEFQKTSYKKESNPNWRGGKEIPCTYCSVLVYRCPSELKKNKNHFCSSKCHDDFRRIPRDPNRLRAEEMKGEKHPRWSGPKYCKICGKELLKRKERKQEICYSEKCMKETRRLGGIKAAVTSYGPNGGRATYTCEYCEKIVEVTKSVAQRRRFCSNKCHISSGENLQFTRPTKLEIAVSGALNKLNLDHIKEFAPRGAPGIYDFYVSELNLLIEADGEFWHHSEWANKNINIQERDKNKTDWAELNGYNLVRLRERDVMKKGATVLIEQALNELQEAIITDVANEVYLTDS